MRAWQTWGVQQFAALPRFSGQIARGHEQRLSLDLGSVESFEAFCRTCGFELSRMLHGQLGGTVHFRVDG